MNIIWNNDYFLIYCNNGNIYYSYDGITWTLLNTFGTKVVNIFIDSSSNWYNDSISTSMLSDISITNPQDGQVLKYNASLDKWVNSS